MLATLWGRGARSLKRGVSVGIRPGKLVSSPILTFGIMWELIGGLKRSLFSIRGLCLPSHPPELLSYHLPRWLLRALPHLHRPLHECTTTPHCLWPRSPLAQSPCCRACIAGQLHQLCCVVSIIFDGNLHQQHDARLLICVHFARHCGHTCTRCSWRSLNI